MKRKVMLVDLQTIHANWILKDGIREAFALITEVYEIRLYTNHQGYQNSKSWLTENLGESWLNKLIIADDVTFIRAEYCISSTYNLSNFYFVPVWQLIIFNNDMNLKGVYRLTGWDRVKNMMSYLRYL